VLKKSRLLILERIRDMNKKWLIVIISLIFIVAIVGAGGKMFIDKRAEQNEAEKIKIEKKSIEALKERYANIKYVIIKDSKFDKKTGAFDVNVLMTNQENESVDFTYTYWTGGQDFGLDLLVDEEVQVRGKTTNTIQVIYSNDEEDEI